MPRRSSRKAAGKLPDIRAVAAVAKVSIATVSRTINGSPLVSDRLKKRVWQAIKQLNYLPNTHARTLVSGRSRLFGIIVENITNPFFPELIQSFEEIAAVGLPSSALFGFPFSGFGAAGRTDSRKAPRAICRRATRSQQLSQRPLVRKGDYEAVPIKASDYSLKWIAAKFDQWHSWT